jgi:hypothetical protein
VEAWHQEWPATPGAQQVDGGEVVVEVVVEVEEEEEEAAEDRRSRRGISVAFVFVRTAMDVR